MEWIIQDFLWGFIAYFLFGVVSVFASVMLYLTSTSRIFKGLALGFLIVTASIHLLGIYVYLDARSENSNLAPLALILPNFMVSLPLLFIQVFLMACENHKNRKQRKAAKNMEDPTRAGELSNSEMPPTS